MDEARGESELFPPSLGLRWVQIACGCVFACGVFGAWVAGKSPWEIAAIDRSIGTAAILALVLAVSAMWPRSWARVPLVAACVTAAALTQDSLLGEHEASQNYLFAYFALNMLLIFAAVVALFITVVEREKRRDAAWRNRRKRP